MNCSSYDNFFINFANRTKLGIMLLLREGPMNVKTIAERTGHEQSAVSHNLRKLSDCHILTMQRVGKERLYSLNKDTVVPMLKIVEDHVKRSCGKECRKWKTNVSI